MVHDHTTVKFMDTFSYIPKEVALYLFHNQARHVDVTKFFS